ncbi:MAG: 3-methyl-2-oxobutanoate hydroxymethyltransferase [Pseudomonadales bacterium]
MQSVSQLQRLKNIQQKISMVTCYDYWSAQLVAASPMDCLLVGDSLAVVMHGYSSTVHATLDLMLPHVAAVARGAGSKLVVADMPFMTASGDLRSGVAAATALIQAGAHAVKIEGAGHQVALIAHLVEAGIPVVGHLGLTPQSVLQLGGHRVQAKNEAAADRLFADAAKVEAAGVGALVLECVPAPVAAKVSSDLKIPVIGIGAGAGVDGQVLVLQDLLGANLGFEPKFLRKYADLSSSIGNALDRYHQDVQSGAFPARCESYA